MAMVANSQAAILDRLLEPENGELAPAAARYILALDFKQADRERMEALAAKARAGALSQGEQTELEDYRHVSHLLALMQSKARMSLKRAALLEIGRNWQ